MESSVSVEMAKHLLFSFGIILAIGTVCGFLSQKIKVPDVAIFLLVGMLAGPAVTGIVNIQAESSLNQIIILFGACYILFDGGASIKLKVLKEVWITLTALATVGVLIMTAITGHNCLLCDGNTFYSSDADGCNHSLDRSRYHRTHLSPGEDQRQGFADSNKRVGI